MPVLLVLVEPVLLDEVESEPLDVDGSVVADGDGLDDADGAGFVVADGVGSVVAVGVRSVVTEGVGSEVVGSVVVGSGSRRLGLSHRESGSTENSDIDIDAVSGVSRLLDGSGERSREHHRARCRRHQGRVGPRMGRRRRHQPEVRRRRTGCSRHSTCPTADSSDYR